MVVSKIGGPQCKPPPYVPVSIRTADSESLAQHRRWRETQECRRRRRPHWTFGLRGSGLGLRVWRLGFRIWGLGLRFKETSLDLRKKSSGDCDCLNKVQYTYIFCHLSSVIHMLVLTLLTFACYNGCATLSTRYPGSSGPPVCQSRARFLPSEH